MPVQKKGGLGKGLGALFSEQNLQTLYIGSDKLYNGIVPGMCDFLFFLNLHFD